MLKFPTPRPQKRRSRSYAELPINLANRKLPPLPVHKRKLPSLPQSSSFRNKCVDDEDSATVPEYTNTKSSPLSKYFKRKKTTPNILSNTNKMKPSVPPPVRTHKKARSDDGQSIREKFQSMFSTSKKNIFSQTPHPSSTNQTYQIPNTHTSRFRSQSERKFPKSPTSTAARSSWRPCLEVICHDRQILSELITFMTKQYNEENIEFLLAVYDLNKSINSMLYNDDGTKEEEEAINIQISVIFDKFVKDDSMKQINVSSQCYKNVMLHHMAFRTYSLDKKNEIFVQCCEEIERLMKKSVLSSFYQCDGFQLIAINRGCYENKKYDDDEIEFSLMSSEGLDDCVSLLSEDMDDYKEQSDEPSKQSVHFDTYSVVKWSSAKSNKYMLSSNALSEGFYQWTMKILKCDEKRQEFGIIGCFDTDIDVKEDGICDTKAFGARAVYGYSHLDSFYYASYNADNTVRCNKDLSALGIHQTKFKVGDVIRISLDMDKGVIKFYLNDKKVRKAVSVDTECTYYPIILYSGFCEYELLDPIH